MTTERFDTDAIIAHTDLVELVSRYCELKPQGHEFITNCVFHSPDKNPSLYIVPDKKIVHCFSCGASESAIGFLMQVEQIDFVKACKKLTNGDETGMPHPKMPKRVLKKPTERMTSAAPSDAPPAKLSIKSLGGEPSKVWTYFDKDGATLGYVCRYDTADGKEIRCFSWGQRGNDVPQWACGHFSKKRPLYGLDRLAASPMAQVIICEGEKATDAATRLFPNMVAVTWPAGANAYQHANWSVLAGRDVILIPDADDAGRQAMQRLATILMDGIAKRVRGIDPETQPDDSETPKGWDIADAPDWTPETAMAWAKARIVTYSPDAPIVASVVAPQHKSQDASERDLSDYSASDDTDIPPDAPALNGEALRLPDDANLQPSKPPKQPASRETEPVMELPPEFSEFGLADRFAAECGQDWRFTREWQTWFKWNGGHWERDISGSITYAISRCVNAARATARNLTEAQHNRICTYKMTRAIELLVASRPEISVASSAWDADPWSLGTPCGVVNLKTGELYDAPREAFVSRSVAVVPTAGETPLFDSVIGRATQGDADLEKYLWRWFGYMLTGSCREESFLFIHGSAASGKSTMIKTLAGILGDYARSCKPAMFEETKHEGHPTELAELAGARLAYASESSEGARFAEAKIKWLTGGDTISAHFMRQDNFQFAPTHKILIHGNHMPQLRSVGEEMRRRIHLVEFPGSIPESDRDKNLKEKLEKEFPAILHRMIQGCLDWQAHGLGKPQHVTAATDDYLQGEDTLGAWLQDCAELGAGKTARSAEAYRSYKKWTDASGEFCPSQKRFSRSLVARGFTIRRTSAGSVIDGFEINRSQDSDIPAGYGYD